jgi:hypothetical protein
MKSLWYWLAAAALGYMVLRGRTMAQTVPDTGNSWLGTTVPIAPNLGGPAMGTIPGAIIGMPADPSTLNDLFKAWGVNTDQLTFGY